MDDLNLLINNLNKNLRVLWLADINGDGVVDNADRLIIVGNQSLTNATRSQGDVDGADLTAWQNQLGNNYLSQILVVG